MIFFLIPLSITFLNPKSLGFLFSTKNSPTWGVKCEKLNFRKSEGIFWSLPQVKEHFRQYLFLRTDILQKTVVGCPWTEFGNSLNKTNLFRSYANQCISDSVLLLTLSIFRMPVIKMPSWKSNRSWEIMTFVSKSFKLRVINVFDLSTSLALLSRGGKNRENKCTFWDTVCYSDMNPV